MSRQSAFKQSDLTRALKAARAAGVDVAEVVLSPSGEIRLKAQTALGASAARRAPNDFDREFGE